MHLDPERLDYTGKMEFLQQTTIMDKKTWDVLRDFRANDFTEHGEEIANQSVRLFLSNDEPNEYVFRLGGFLGWTAIKEHIKDKTEILAHLQKLWLDPRADLESLIIEDIHDLFFNNIEMANFVAITLLERATEFNDVTGALLEVLLCNHNIPDDLRAKSLQHALRCLEHIKENEICSVSMFSENFFILKTGREELCQRYVELIRDGIIQDRAEVASRLFRHLNLRPEQKQLILDTMHRWAAEKLSHEHLIYLIEEDERFIDIGIKRFKSDESINEYNCGLLKKILRRDISDEQRTEVIEHAVTLVDKFMLPYIPCAEEVSSVMWYLLHEKITTETREKLLRAGICVLLQDRVWANNLERSARLAATLLQQCKDPEKRQTIVNLSIAGIRQAKTTDKVVYLLIERMFKYHNMTQDQTEGLIESLNHWILQMKESDRPEIECLRKVLSPEQFAKLMIER